MAPSMLPISPLRAIPTLHSTSQTPPNPTSSPNLIVLSTCTAFGTVQATPATTTRSGSMMPIKRPTATISSAPTTKALKLSAARWVSPSRSLPTGTTGISVQQLGRSLPSTVLAPTATIGLCSKSVIVLMAIHWTTPTRFGPSRKTATNVLKILYRL